jgi:hypothetical protein
MVRCFPPDINYFPKKERTEMPLTKNATAFHQFNFLFDKLFQCLALKNLLPANPCYCYITRLEKSRSVVLFFYSIIIFFLAVPFISSLHKSICPDQDKIGIDWLVSGKFTWKLEGKFVMDGDIMLL